MVDIHTQGWITHFCCLTIIVTLTDGWGLHLASTRQGQGLSLVDVDSHWWSTPAQNLTQALWLWSYHTCKLWAASWRWGWGIPCDIVEARWQAHYHICATRLRCSSCVQHCHHDQNQTHLHFSVCHWNGLMQICWYPFFLFWWSICWYPLYALRTMVLEERGLGFCREREGRTPTTVQPELFGIWWWPICCKVFKPWLWDPYYII